MDLNTSPAQAAARLDDLLAAVDTAAEAELVPALREAVLACLLLARANLRSGWRPLPQTSHDEIGNPAVRP